MITSLDELLAEFKVEKDIVGLWQVAGQIQDLFPIQSKEQVIRTTLGFVRMMLANGFKAGCSPYSATGFVLWTSQTPEEVVSRIEIEWKGDEKTADLQGVWFLPPGMNN